MVAATAVLLAASAAHGEEKARPYLKPVTSFWEHLEEGKFAGPRGVCFDRVNDEVWVADTQNNRVAVFTPDGMPLYTASPGKAVREPVRILIDRSSGRQRLLVIDNDRSRIAVLDFRGDYLGPLDLPGLPERPVFGALALDDAGGLYVGENAEAEVLVYNPDRTLRFRFGGRGVDEGQFKSIAGIAVDATRIVVVDHQAIAVQIFDRRGNFQRGFGRHAMGIEHFSLPESVALDSKGHIVVVDALRHEIKFFDGDGTFIDRFGGLGRGPGEVAYPVDLAIDGKDRFYVVERGNGRVQVMQELEWTPPPTPPGRPGR